jgi:hypothetical protein
VGEPEDHQEQRDERDERQGFLTGDEHWLGGQAIELERVVNPSGNVKVGPQQFWIGPVHVGRRLAVWMDTTTVHLSLDGVHLKTVPSRQTTVSLTRLRSAGARPAGPPPRGAAGLTGPNGTLDAVVGSSIAVEVDRVVNASGLISIAGRYVSVGQSLAGRRITLRLDGDLGHVIDDGVLVRTLPAPVPTALRGRLHGVRLADPQRPLAFGPLRIQRRVSSRGAIQVAGQRLQVGFAHRHTLVDVVVHDAEFHVYDQAGEQLLVIPRISGKEVTRTKGYGVRDRVG